MSKKIVLAHKKNFETLTRAFREGQVCLLDCVEKSTGEHVAVICATQWNEEGEVDLMPFARFFNGNPYDMLEPPDPDKTEKKRRVKRCTKTACITATEAVDRE